MNSHAIKISNYEHGGLFRTLLFALYIAAHSTASLNRERHFRVWVPPKSTTDGVSQLFRTVTLIRVSSRALSNQRPLFGYFVGTTARSRDGAGNQRCFCSHAELIPLKRGRGMLDTRRNSIRWISESKLWNQVDWSRI